MPREGQGYREGLPLIRTYQTEVICLLSWLSPALSASQDRRTTERSRLLFVPGEGCRPLLVDLHAVMTRLQLDLL